MHNLNVPYSLGTKTAGDVQAKEEGSVTPSFNIFWMCSIIIFVSVVLDRVSMPDNN